MAYFYGGMAGYIKVADTFEEGATDSWPEFMELLKSYFALNQPEKISLAFTIIASMLPSLEN